MPDATAIEIDLKGRKPPAYIAVEGPIGAGATSLSRGLADRFGHSTGHGIGLDVHEAPRIHARGDHALRAGNVVTIEPGVYVPGRGGIRIEQDVVVETDGCRVLTTASTDLIEL